MSECCVPPSCALYVCLCASGCEYSCLYRDTVCVSSVCMSLRARPTWTSLSLSLALLVCSPTHVSAPSPALPTLWSVILVASIPCPWCLSPMCSALGLLALSMSVHCSPVCSVSLPCLLPACQPLSRCVCPCPCRPVPSSYLLARWVVLACLPIMRLSSFFFCSPASVIVCLSVIACLPRASAVRLLSLVLLSRRAFLVSALLLPSSWSFPVRRPLVPVNGLSSPGAVSVVWPANYVSLFLPGLPCAHPVLSLPLPRLLPLQPAVGHLPIASAFHFTAACVLLWLSSCGLPVRVPPVYFFPLLGVGGVCVWGAFPFLRWKVWNMCREYFTIILNVSGCFFKKGKEGKKGY